MKSPGAFRTISEAAAELGTPQHVLRFWETKFSFIRPMKRAGGRRFYRRQDIDVLRGVRALLHDQGYTIKGVQKLHKDHGMRRILEAGGPEGEASAPKSECATAPAPHLAPLDLLPGRPVIGPAARARLTGVLEDLEDVKTRLDALLAGENS